jgi:hypothetical protein
MATTLRVLAQLAPSAGSETTLYTCATTSAVISSLFVCNTSSSTADTFTVRICVAGAADVAKQIIFSASSINPSTTLSIVAGITVANTDVIKVTSTNGTTSFSIFGQENS